MHVKLVESEQALCIVVPKSFSRFQYCSLVMQVDIIGKVGRAYKGPACKF